MALQIPFIPQFKHRKISFNYFIRALYITDRGRKKALSMHLIGPEAQKIYGSLSKTKSPSLDSTIILKFKKMYHVKAQYSIKLTNNLGRAMNNSLHD